MEHSKPSSLVTGMITKRRVEDVLADIRFQGWEFVVDNDRASWIESGGKVVGGNYVTSRLYLQVRVDGACNVTGDPLRWSGRKWFLSPHMTKSEVVQTAFKAVMTAIEHEAREQFTYRGLTIFDPHYDLDKLAALRGGADCLDGRDAG